MQGMSVIDFRQGRYQDVLQDVVCDAVICDPPYSARTHEGHSRVLRYSGGGLKALPDSGERREINYPSWDASDVEEFVKTFSGRCNGWIVALTDHVLWPIYESCFLDAGRYVFQPVPCVIRGMSVRICGDGPSSWAVYAVVARPRWDMPWGTLPGAYTVGRGDISNASDKKVMGSKPLALMNAIIRDYSRPGDLICDPCAGGATTLIAAATQGRRAVGAEMDPDTFKKAQARIAKGYTPDFLEASA